MTDLQNQGLPAFYNDAPTITLKDPLAEFLGAAQHGILEYRYVDVVRLAGHSCPTVAGAYLMALHGLRALYEGDMPVRGNVEVFMRDGPGNGVTGVIASVLQLITGAAGETGFPGAGSLGLFTRKNLLSFDAAVDGELGMRRKDTGQAVTLHLNASVVPWPEEMRQLIPKAFSQRANSEELARFAQLWQERVRQMLVDHAHNPALVWTNEWKFLPKMASSAR